MDKLAIEICVRDDGGTYFRDSLKEKRYGYRCLFEIDGIFTSLGLTSWIIILDEEHFRAKKQALKRWRETRRRSPEEAHEESSSDAKLLPSYWTEASNHAFGFDFHVGGPPRNMHPESQIHMSKST
ncbi:uncharacterized protein CLUP02_15337 [Colletotrichum lupini]|uniref:Uncharacterized protein n=1 Tax=Colletotrichum lupini TaxID=145971 RepID=A0A9Q8T5W3_9PEZI|nr:uncharacterized protein CLUP02_15337 [Colletotrichum lupini]UQC89806.1 hypothetical protein CLUP02_15337 [Colletotrichum lupini]